MKGIGAIFGKEMARIFKDKKMIFSVFFLPVLIMVGIMGLVGMLSAKEQEQIQEHRSIVYMVNEPEGFTAFLKSSSANIEKKQITSEAEMENAKQELMDGNIDLIMEFPKNLEADVVSYQEGDAVPQIKTYYNPSEEYSATAYQLFSEQGLETYRQMLLTSRVNDLSTIQIFTVNSDNPDMVVQNDEKASGKMLGTLLPYFVTILLFAGAMGIGADMIAGEKERGTMASLLVSPVKRKSIVLGKVLALMALSGISAVIYIVAMGVSFPLMISQLDGEMELNISISVQQIVMLGVLMVALAFLYSTIIALVSVFARDTKEANTYIMPAYMVILVIGLMTMISSKTPDATAYYIPVYNTSLVLKGIFTRDVTMAQYGITVGMTLLLGAILTAVIAKAFESEKVMSM